ncbi:MAG TPA: SRPBCC domain-containing protein [Burkholderiales bacterium]|nr:SRPBCC domain-containing protein [Burkholderiales bacterium]
MLECDPPRRLSYTFTSHIDEGGYPERPSRVTFELQPMGATVKLTMTHDDFDEGSEVLRGVSNGWPAILSSLKSLLESGRLIEYREAEFACG